MRASINDPKYWQDRCEESRAIADALTDLDAKAAMHKVADSYAFLAQKAAERLLADPSLASTILEA
jgi:hypothetical protein